MSDAIKYGYIQLDSRIVQNSATGMWEPEYPSILLGCYKESKQAILPQTRFIEINSDFGLDDRWNKYVTEYVSYLGTDLSNFVVTHMDKNGIIPALMLTARASGEVESHTFTFYGYVPFDRVNGVPLTDRNPWELRITINVMANSDNDRCAVKWVIAVYDDEGNRRLETDVLNQIIEKTNDDFEYFKKGYNKLYLNLITPYDRDVTMSTEALRCVNAYTYKKDTYFKTTDASDGDTSVGEDTRFLNVYATPINEILEYFHADYEEDKDNIVGEQGDILIDYESDDITIPALPSDRIINGLHNMYYLDGNDLANMSKALWSTDFATNFLKIINNPMDAIISLAISPSTPPLSENKYPIVVGNLPMVYSEELIPVTARKLTSQYGTIDFGSLDIQHTYGTFQDYNVSFDLYLPFISTVKLNSNDIMGSRITLKYNVDYLTGNAIAFLHIFNNKSGVNGVMYQWKGNILSNIPLTGVDYSNTIVTGLNTVMNLGSSGISGAVTNTLTSLKPNLERGGNVSANAGALGIYEPYLIITIPNEYRPQLHDALKGMPLNDSISLSQGMGYVKADVVHINGTYATSEEITELENLIKNGIYL